MFTKCYRFAEWVALLKNRLKDTHLVETIL